MFSFEGKFSLEKLEVMRFDASEGGTPSVRYVDAVVQCFEQVCKDVADPYKRYSTFSLLVGDICFVMNCRYRESKQYARINMDTHTWGCALYLYTGYRERVPLAIWRDDTRTLHRLGLAELAANGIGSTSGKVLKHGFSRPLTYFSGNYVSTGLERGRWLEFCCRCGKVGGHMEETHDGKHVCDECAEGFEVCERCGRFTLDRYTVHTDDSLTEEWCATCRDCHSFWCEYHERQESSVWFERTYVNGYGDVCEEGFEGCDACYCECCDEYYLPEWGVECSDGEWRCDSCAEEYENENSAVHDYYYKPDPRFVNEDGSRSLYEREGALYLGIELETDNGEGKQFAQDIDAELGDYIYCKDDGSLNCGGVELVTHPLEESFAYEWGQWENIRTMALARGMRSHDAGTCGLHMHVNRGFFGKGIQQDYNVAKLLYVFERFFDELCKFSRRRSRDLSWCNKTCGGFSKDDNDELIQRKLIDVSRDRYQAVNLCNESTVEIRLWRGTLKVETIKVTIDFTQALMRYVVCHDFPTLMGLESFSELVDGVGEHAHDAEAIREYAESRRCFNA